MASYWLALSSLGPPCASSRTGPSRIVWNWKPTGIESKPGRRSIGSPRWTKETLMFLPIVIRAEYGGEFRIRVTFNDGLETTIDFSEWLAGPIFEPLKDPAYFERFFIDGGTVAWQNGAD